MERFHGMKEKLRLAVIEHDYEPPSLTIVDATDGDVGNAIYVARRDLASKLQTIYDNWMHGEMLRIEDTVI